MKKIVIGLKEILFLVLLYPVARLYGFKRNIWIISERGTDARDNGFHMFKYMKIEHPSVKTYYIIDDTASDRKRVAEYGNLVKYKSVKHYFLQYAANVRISTHICGFATTPAFYLLVNRLHKLPGLSISLKHGITKDNIPSLYAENARLDLVIAGAKPEYDYMMSNFHYNKENLQYTGFARFDALVSTSAKKQILVMPTWRTYLRKTEEKDFKKSKYYLCWSTFINDAQLQSYLEQKNLILVFYPHYEIQPYIHLFNSNSKNIIIADKNHFDVQELLKSSDLLITDYSSVFFDFAYMDKPCIYYHFDDDEYRQEHYTEGYFDYKTMGFGEVVESNDELISVLISYIESGFETKPIFESRYRAFFPLHDNNNCERIYTAIMSLMQR